MVVASCYFAVSDFGDTGVDRQHGSDNTRRDIPGRERPVMRLLSMVRALVGCSPLPSASTIASASQLVLRPPGDRDHRSAASRGEDRRQVITEGDRHGSNAMPRCCGRYHRAAGGGLRRHICPQSFASACLTGVINEISGSRQPCCRSSRSRCDHRHQLLADSSPTRRSG